MLTIGTFDLLHYGHIAFLQECALLGERLVVGVNTDRFVREFKPPAIMNQDERAYALQLQGYETRFNDSAGAKLIEAIRPNVLTIGTDWAPSRGKDFLAQVGVTQNWLDAQRITVAWIPYVQNYRISTSDIRRRVLEAG